ncbi:unannotated protein [freshwater metagenome]|uniref:Unannotated protein n=1 Tax=freshwater metagenome TaxID=449393 RepID=A0A6J6EVT2_9ZZZZ
MKPAKTKINPKTTGLAIATTVPAKPASAVQRQLRGALKALLVFKSR